VAVNTVAVNTEIRPPAWAIRNGCRLSPAEFGAAFAERLPSTSRIVKSESWPTYQEPDTRSLREYLAGNLDQVWPLLEAEADLDEAAYTRVRRHGMQFLRLRTVRLPLSGYLIFEMENYRVRSHRGETIEIADQTGDPQPLPNHSVFDFLLFDETAALVHDYGEIGLLSGGWLTTDPLALASLASIASAIKRRSVPLEAFLTSHGIRSPLPVSASAGSRPPGPPAPGRIDPPHPPSEPPTTRQAALPRQSNTAGSTLMNDTLTGLAFALLALALGLSLALVPRGLDPAHREPIALVVATAVAFLLAGTLQLAVGGVALAVIDGTALIACVATRIGRRPLVRWATTHPMDPGAQLLLALRDAANADPYRRLLEPLVSQSQQTSCRPELTMTAGDWTSATLRCRHGTYPGRDADGSGLVAAAVSAVVAWQHAHIHVPDALQSASEVTQP